MMSAMFSHIERYPRVNSVIGAAAGWASVDFLRTAQITAAVLAALVSLCSLVLIAPKVVEQLRKWFSRS